MPECIMNEVEVKLSEKERSVYDELRQEMLAILASMAESESRSISENEKWSIKKRFQNGTYVISYPPYGYANVDGEMVIVPEQAEVVKEIFASCLAGKELVDFLNGAEPFTEWDDSLFERFVEKVKVLSRDEVEFELKFGLKLKERID